MWAGQVQGYELKQGLAHVAFSRGIRLGRFRAGRCWHAPVERQVGMRQPNAAGPVASLCRCMLPSALTLVHQVRVKCVYGVYNHQPLLLNVGAGCVRCVMVLGGVRRRSVGRCSAVGPQQDQLHSALEPHVWVGKAPLQVLCKSTWQGDDGPHAACCDCPSAGPCVRLQSAAGEMLARTAMQCWAQALEPSGACGLACACIGGWSSRGQGIPPHRLSLRAGWVCMGVCLAPCKYQPKSWLTPCQVPTRQCAGRGKKPQTRRGSTS
jgi:hypothetical protein